MAEIIELKEDYKDDILAESNIRRKYQMIQNEDGTVSFIDMTAYSQTGDRFSSSDVNKANSKINGVYDDRILDLEELSLVTESGYFPDALAVKEIAKNGVKEIGENEDGWCRWIKFYDGTIFVFIQIQHTNVALTTKKAEGVYTNDSLASRMQVYPDELKGIITEAFYANSNVESSGFTTSCASGANENGVTYRVWSSYSIAQTTVRVRLFMFGRYEE